MTSSSHFSDVDKIMHKFKKQDDLFVYEGGEVYYKCGLKASRSISYNLERYFGCPLELESCGFYEKLKLWEIVDAKRMDKEKIIQRKNAEIAQLRSRIKALKSLNTTLVYGSISYIDGLVKKKGFVLHVDFK